LKTYFERSESGIAISRGVWQEREGEMTRINLCSGQRKFEKPWVNVDINPKWNPDVVADGRDMPMFGNESADLIVIQHGVEHFGCGEAEGMLRECHRILVPGGSLLVFVPDMEALARGWLEGRISDQVYMTNVYGAYMGEEADRHRWGYTYCSLRRLLRDAFRTFPFDWRKIPGADIAKDWWILGVEAVK
jgi:predicted SAM-dependent methyltransferase